MGKVAIIDKAPSKNKYENYFDFDFDLYHMSSVAIPKLLKKDIDLVVDLEPYDFVILVGSEAAKNYAKITSVTNFAGVLVDDKYIAMSNPSVLIFKPEGKPEFESTIKKINSYVSGTLTNATVSGDFAGIQDEAEAMEYLLKVLNSGVETVAMDTETTSLYPRDGHILGMSMSYMEKEGRYIDADVLTDEHLQVVQQIIDKYNIVMHNMKFDYKWMQYHFGLKFHDDQLDDTMVEHYVLDETEGSHGLKSLALKHTTYGDYDSDLDNFKKQYCKDNGITEAEFHYGLIPFSIMYPYAAIDTAVTLELHNKFRPIIAAHPKLSWVYDNILMPGIIFLTHMEEEGIPMDLERLTGAEGYLDKWIGEAKEEVYNFPDVKRFEETTKKIFNPNSVPQLRSLLFDYCGLASTGKLTKTGALSTDAEVLEELSEIHPLPAAILKVRQLGKIKSSYISKIIPELDKDGRIRTNFNLTFTTSGRLSSSGKFNAQQIPRDDPIIKGCIKAPKGYKIVSQDLATAEVYYAAVLAKDVAMQKIFSGGGDLHSSIAKMVFNLPCEVEQVKNLYPLDRQASKAVTFGILYGSGPAKVTESVNKEGGNMTIADAREIIKDYFNTFKGVKKWLADRKEFIEANGYTYSFFGRKRRLANVFSTDKGIAAHEVRSGINAEVQSLASDMNLLGAIDTQRECNLKKLDAKIFMLVHDSIVAIVREDLVDEYCEILKRNTQKDRGCSITGTPIGVDQEVGDDYSFGKFDKRYTLAEGMLHRIESK
jgi:DNA polymerase I-like protein with 3'-5' exonuclease and polymerase domains